MKLNKLIVLMTLLVMSSCQKGRGNDIIDSFAEKYEIFKYNAQEWLQNSIIVVDDEGNMIRRVNGEPLDPSDTTVISVPAINLDMAETVFHSWVAPGEELIEIDDDKTDGEIDGYLYNLTDEDNNLLGSVEFRYEDEDPTVLATMTLSSDQLLHLVTEVEFVDYDHWPNNADEVVKYEQGNTYSILAPYIYAETNENGKLEMMTEYKEIPFYCIQGNDEKTEALLVHLSPDSNDKNAHPNPAAYLEGDAYMHIATLPEAVKVLNYFQSEEKKSNFYKAMEHMGWEPQSGENSTGSYKFLINDYNSEKNLIRCLDLDSKGEIYDISVNNPDMYRYILVLTESFISDDSE